MIGIISMVSIRHLVINSCNLPLYTINSKHINDLTLEHVFPKCYMSKKSYNDMHNIFSCNNRINNYRSNYKFIDIKNSDYYNNIKDFIRIDNTDNYYSPKLKLFIPENESKGIISRAIMYISYEYKYKYDKIIDYNNLINWCIDYPPEKHEIFHNNLIAKKQFKRNKFIDLYHKKNYIKYITKLFL
jgi:endonuclease I